MSTYTKAGRAAAESFDRAYPGIHPELADAREAFALEFEGPCGEACFCEAFTKRTAELWAAALTIGALAESAKRSECWRES